MVFVTKHKIRIVRINSFIYLTFLPTLHVNIEDNEYEINDVVIENKLQQAGVLKKILSSDVQDNIH